MSCLHFLSLIFIFSVCNRSLGEIYTSMTSVKQAILSERRLIDHLRTYIDRETQRLEDLQRMLQEKGGNPKEIVPSDDRNVSINKDLASLFYSKVFTFHNGLSNEITASMANPLAAFTLIKRLHSEWLNIIYSGEAEENLQDLKVIYEGMESSLPKLEDLKGAAQGLMRLQDVYALEVKGLVRGNFQGIRNGSTVDIYKPSISIRLSGDDCYLVGKVAYDVKDYYHSVQWLEEAVRLLRDVDWSPENEDTLVDALDHLAFSHFKTGNISSALSFSLELLHYDTLNSRVLQNVEKYEKLLVKSSAMQSSESVLKRPSTTYLRTRDLYERLCQSQGSQMKLHEDPRLFCDYYTNGSPGLFLQPMKRELVSLQPYVVLFHDFVSGAEAKNIRDSAMPGLRRSVVASGLNQTTVDYRISKSAWLSNSVHPVISKVDRRITLLTGLNVQLPYGEYLQVVNYGIGGHYEPHFDHATSTSSPLYSLNSGNRMATFMIYLSSVEAGGSTAFIYANFSVRVVENSALFWWNLHRNGHGNGDTLHAGCPVLVGDKWVANKWVHEYGQEFQRRCSCNPDE